MLTRAQIILLKRGQREAGLDDAEYRDALQTVSGLRSSTDRRMTDRHLDLLLAYFEAIHWRKADRGELQPRCKPDAVFRQRGFWAAKNPGQATSRDRFTVAKLADDIANLESALAELGFGAEYCGEIWNRVGGAGGIAAAHHYKAALRRTLRAKQNALCGPQVR